MSAARTSPRSATMRDAEIIAAFRRLPTRQLQRYIMALMRRLASDDHDVTLDTLDAVSEIASTRAMRRAGVR